LPNNCRTITKIIVFDTDESNQINDYMSSQWQIYNPPSGQN